MVAWHPLTDYIVVTKRVTACDGERVWLGSDNPVTGTDSRHFGEVERLMAMVSSYEARTADSARQATGRQQPAQPEPAWPSFDLNGKQVALIGGLTKAAAYYELAIRQLGGSCVQHDGNVNQGQKRLAKMIRQSDVVFCLVDCVSHGMVNSAKKRCRTLLKRKRHRGRRDHDRRRSFTSADVRDFDALASAPRGRPADMALAATATRGAPRDPIRHAVATTGANAPACPHAQCGCEPDAD